MSHLFDKDSVIDRVTSFDDMFQRTAADIMFELLRNNYAVAVSTVASLLSRWIHSLISMNVTCTKRLLLVASQYFIVDAYYSHIADNDESTLRLVLYMKHPMFGRNFVARSPVVKAVICTSADEADIFSIVMSSLYSKSLLANMSQVVVDDDVSRMFGENPDSNSISGLISFGIETTGMDGETSTAIGRKTIVDSNSVTNTDQV